MKPGAPPARQAVAGTAGYADQAAALIAQYDALDPAEVHRAFAAFFSRPPCSVLDVGAGSGRDAAWLAGKGHRVVAVEPVEAFRSAASARFAGASIDWIDDALPDLGRTRALGRRFDLILASAVWMHLDPDERRAGMATLAALLETGGLLCITLRHGPVPAGRRMFDVGAEETIELAHAHGLQVLLSTTTPSVQPSNLALGVGWSQLALCAA